MQRLVAAEAGLLEPAEWRGNIAMVEAVDPDHAGAERRRRLEGFVDVPGPDRGGQPVGRVVADGQRLVEVACRDGGKDRPEDLLARDRHLAGDVVKQRGLDEATVP